MKIALIVPIAFLNLDPAIRNCWGIGGSEISSFFLAQELNKRGHEVTIFSFDTKEEREEEIAGITFKRYPPNRADIRKGCIFLKKGLFNSYDIVHFYGLALFRYSYAVKLLNNVKTVVTLNYYSTVCSNKCVMKNHKICKRCNFMDLLNCSHSIGRTLKIEIYRLLSFLNDAYIVLSDSSKKAFEMFGFPASRIYVIPNFIPKVTYTKRTNKTGNTSILYAGRLDETKGLDLLIKALPKVKEKIDFLKCYIVGAGPERQNLKKLAERLDVLDNVCFTGFINYKYLGEYYLKSDIFVFPVRWLEPFGRVLLEAMTYRLPIITSETIDHEIAKGAALTFKTNDYNDLADKIIYLLSNEDVQERLSKTGLEQVKNFYPEKVVPKLEEVYMEIIQK